MPVELPVEVPPLLDPPEDEPSGMPVVLPAAVDDTAALVAPTLEDEGVPAEVLAPLELPAALPVVESFPVAA